MTENTNSRIQDEFNSLPLEEKFANLFKMEAATLGEALKYVADSSMKFVEQAGEAIKDLSSKIEAEVKKASECKTNGNGSSAEGPEKTDGSAKQTPRSKKKPN
jgi:hypothetical protein